MHGLCGVVFKSVSIPEEEPMNSDNPTIRQEALLAVAILTALSRPGRKIEDISSLLFKLKGSGEDIGSVALKRVPGGFYSEDIEELVGHYLAAGYARQMSPVELTEQGQHVLEEIVELERRENPEILDRIQAKLAQFAA
jgi:hypothetical protein